MEQGLSIFLHVRAARDLLERSSAAMTSSVPTALAHRTSRMGFIRSYLCFSFGAPCAICHGRRTTETFWIMSFCHTDVDRLSGAKLKRLQDILFEPEVLAAQRHGMHCLFWDAFGRLGVRINVQIHEFVYEVIHDFTFEFIYSFLYIYTHAYICRHTRIHTCIHT